MNCEKCQVALEITRSVKSPGGKRVLETECPKCGNRYTAITLLFEPVDGYGTGARGVASRVADGLELRRPRDGAE